VFGYPALIVLGFLVIGFMSVIFVIFYFLFLFGRGQAGDT